jgi:hypothetical protein
LDLKIFNALMFPGGLFPIIYTLVLDFVHLTFKHFNYFNVLPVVFWGGGKKIFFSPDDFYAKEVRLPLLS